MQKRSTPCDIHTTEVWPQSHTRWVRLKYAAMNLKKLAKWSWENSIFSKYIVLFNAYIANPPVFAWQKPGVL